MWWLLMTGLFFCAFQFKWISPSMGIAWKVGAGFGFMVIFYAVRRLAVWKAIEGDRNESLRLLADYQSRFGRGNDIRDVVSGFGEGFGQEYSRDASESGDLLHTLVGEGISYASNLLAGATKSSDQIRLENRIQVLSDRIDAKDRQATQSLVMALASAAILTWMSVQGRIPL